MIKLVNILKELFLSEAIVSNHYAERKDQRGKILDIIIPPASYEGYSREETVNKLLPLLQSELYKRLEILEKSTLGISNKFNVAYIVFSPSIKNKDQVYPIKMETVSLVGTSSVEKEYVGEAYIVFVRENTLVTLVIVDNTKDSSIKEKMEDHDKRNNKLNNREYTVVRNPSANFVVDIDILFGKEIEKPKEEKIDISGLPYKVRTDYRAGATFTHDVYGSGKIVDTSSGSKGTANARGTVDWIEVDFGKPYLSGGKLYKTRRFNNVYTSVYFK